MFQLLVRFGEIMHTLFPHILLWGIVIYSFVLRKKLEHSPIKFKRNLTAVHGIVFGRKAGLYAYSPSHAEGHIAVFGGSGLGKTSALLIPTLQSWDGCSLTIDISGDISSNVDIPNKLIYSPMKPLGIP